MTEPTTQSPVELSPSTLALPFRLPFVPDVHVVLIAPENGSKYMAHRVRACSSPPLTFRSATTHSLPLISVRIGHPGTARYRLPQNSRADVSEILVDRDTRVQSRPASTCDIARADAYADRSYRQASRPLLISLIRRDSCNAPPEINVSRSFRGCRTTRRALPLILRRKFVQSTSQPGAARASDAATSSPMKLAPITTTLRASSEALMIALLSASDRR